MQVEAQLDKAYEKSSLSMVKDGADGKIKVKSLDQFFILFDLLAEKDKAHNEVQPLPPT